MTAQTAPTAPALDFLGAKARILSDAASGGGMLGLVEIEAPPGDMPPLHVHHAEHEGFYMLEGSATLFTPGREVTLEPGDFFLAPRGVPHTYETGDEGARWLVTSTPAHFEAFVRDVAEAGPVDPPALTALAARHQIEILGPPGARP